MPNKYVRRVLQGRGTWTQDQLTNAINAVKRGQTIRSAAATNGIPRKTLERRLKTGNEVKGKMGPSSLFGDANELRLVQHIKKMQKSGFPVTRNDVRMIAYQFAEYLGINHKFSNEKEKAGYDWLILFLSRHPTLSVRKAEGVSIARSQGMNKQEVMDYFEILREALEENELFDKPSNIFNMDESGLQLNNRPSQVIAEKGSKSVSSITSTERGETITIIACCNSEGTFLPPACIMKGKNKKAEFEDGMPPGSVLYMSQKSAYITAAIFLEWLKNHFLPRKPAGKVLLILDGHTSHTNSVEMLEFASSNDIALLSLPSHTTHYLQPLDRAVFKSIKTHFYEACRNWLKNHPGRRITRAQFGYLLNQTWGKAATPGNAVSGFKSTGIYPFNPNAIPDYAYSQENVTVDPSDASDRTLPSASAEEIERRATCTVTTAEKLEEKSGTSEHESLQKETPTKILMELSPVPGLIHQTRKRAKKVAEVLTSRSYIEARVDKENRGKPLKRGAGTSKATMQKENPKKEKTDSRAGSSKPAVKKRKIKKEETDSSNEEFSLDSGNDLIDSDNDVSKEEVCLCAGCGEDYEKTEKIEDWLQCIKCRVWMHENCTIFDNMCPQCGEEKKKKVKGQRRISKKK